MSLKDNSLFKKLISLNLPTEDFAVFGSGPMFAYGLRKSIHDIDLIARGQAWEKAKTLGQEHQDKCGIKISRI